MVWEALRSACGELMRVLVVEDYQLLRESLASGLKQLGYAVDAAADGVDGLWYAENHPYDAMILDLMLPKLGGLELLRRVVAHTREPHLLGTDGRPNFGLKLYLLSKSGEYAGVSLWGPTDFAVADANGARLEACEFLFDMRTG